VSTESAGAAMTDHSDSSGGPLRRVLQDARGPGVSMKDLTVLATQNDPYRIDTPSGHRDGQWFAEQFEWVREHLPRPHLRDIHYVISTVGREILKPNGDPYQNTDEDWAWLQSQASKAARWLGYVPFDAIRDNRNDPPLVRPTAPMPPIPYFDLGEIKIEIPSVEELEPRVGCCYFEGRQPYRIVLWGEKSSLADVLEPISNDFDADIYLPTGEISDTLLYQMAKEASLDGRPLKVFTLADFDPAGHQMPISIGRKLQAFRDLEFTDLDFEVRSVALTVEQVHEFALPSKPLKEKEKRADRWRAAFGVEQTEINALSSLQPLLLDQIIRDALRPFYDFDLWLRVRRAHSAWRERAGEVMAAHIDLDLLDRIRNQATEKLSELEGEIAALNEALRQDVPSWIPLPEVEIPEPEIDESLHGKPLVSSRWSWPDQTRSLIERKSYGDVA